MPKIPFRPLLLALAALLLTPVAASARGTVRLTSDQFTVREGDGDAVITVVRDDTSGAGEIRYDAYYDRSAEANQDWTPVQGRIDFAPGQSEAAFRIPIIDDPIVEKPETIKVGIYGPYPMALGEPNRGILTILDNDVVETARDAVNPLLLDPPPSDGNPLENARFYLDRQWNVAQQAIERIKHKQPGTAAELRAIADEPETKRFGSWTTQPRHEVSTFLQRVQTEDPGSVPLVATYRLKHLKCGNVADTPEEAEAYKHWYDQFAAGIGNQRIVLFYEIDALITSKCLSRTGLNRRTEELRYVIDRLAALPHAVVYLDAGSGLAHAPRYIAWMLRRVHADKIQGFFTNATHQDWTLNEYRYGRKLVRMLGGRPHFVINTSSNGRGPLVPKDRVKHGNSFRCNARGRGLGPRSTGTIDLRRYPSLDGLIWIGNPGRSAGNCSGSTRAPPTGTFWVDYALELIKNADYRIR